ncbi:MAG: glycosyltransferase family 4 protein [Candidatus Pacebacteria bacterium]|nr:glycosyltransferase family 4 protein [Candidatus Paceibacterota bacterium]
MKILVLQDDFPPKHLGGAGAIAFSLAKELQRRGHEILVVTTVRDSADAGAMEFEGLRLERIASSYDLRFKAYAGLWNPFALGKLGRILKEYKPDVVHAHNVHTYLSYFALAAAKRSGARVILTCHDVQAFNYTKFTDFIDPTDLSIPKTFNYRVNAWRQLRANRFRYNPLRNTMIRYVLHTYVDRIVAVSDALRQALEANGIGNVRVIHNGIDVPSWHLPQTRIDAFKKKHNLGNSVILFGGRLSGVKGKGKTVLALEQVSKDAPDAQLMIIGKVEECRHMLYQAEELGIGERLVFTDWISGEELRAAYHASAVIVVPTLSFDSFPTMNLEAGACSKPAIATCFGGSRELILDGVTGYIINPFDIPTFAQHITRLLKDPEMSRAFGKAAYDRVSSVFSLERKAEEYERLYTSDHE